MAAMVTHAPLPDPVERAKTAELMASAQLKDTQAEHIRRQDDMQVPVEALRARSARAKAQAEALGAVAGMHKAAAEIAKAGTEFP